MPKDLKDFPRPLNDNGRGLHGSLDTAWTGGEQGLDYWVGLLSEMNIKWFKVLDDGGNSLPFCEKLLAAGIFPIVRILRRDPPPNNTPEPNPGHIGVPEEKTIRRLIDAGVFYFETNNEPNLPSQWKSQVNPNNQLEAAKLVALNWLFDARLILAMGGFPGLPAISSGGEMDLMGALATLGRQDILLEGCWIALHNYCQNRPLNYPDDSVHRSGQPLTSEQFDQGSLTKWAWWNTTHARIDDLNEINSLRANLANPASTIEQDHTCFREFEYYNALAMKYLGRSIPVLSTEGGYRVGRREDLRYPRVTPDAHREQTIALYDFMQRQAPDYYFAATPTLLVESDEREPDAWHSAFWQRATINAPYGFDGIPDLALTGATLSDKLPVIDAAKQMQNLARRMPGAQPMPPVQPTTPSIAEPLAKPIPPTTPKPAVAKPVVPEPAPSKESFPSWLRDTPPTAPVAPMRTAIAEKVAPIEPETSVIAEQAAPIVAKQEPVKEPMTPIEQAAPIVTTPKESVKQTIATPIIPSFDSIPPPPPEHIVQGDIESSTEFFKPTPVMPSAIIEIPDDLEWDWRLHALGVVLEPANVKPGQAYWKLVRAIYQAPDESNDSHQIYYTVVDQQNNPVEYQKVWQGWSDGETEAITNDRGEANIPLWVAFAPDRGERGAYVAWVDGLVSDRVSGMGLPLKRHVNFLLTFKRAVATFMDTERR